MTKLRIRQWLLVLGISLLPLTMLLANYYAQWRFKDFNVLAAEFSEAQFLLLKYRSLEQAFFSQPQQNLIAPFNYFRQEFVKRLHALNRLSGTNPGLEMEALITEVRRHAKEFNNTSTALQQSGNFNKAEQEFMEQRRLFLNELALSMEEKMRHIGSVLQQQRTEFEKFYHLIGGLVAVIFAVSVVLLVRSLALTNKLEEEADKRKLQMAKAEVANEAKTQFIASISHELCTPLNAVIGFSKRLLASTDNLSPRQIDAIKTIHRTGNHLLVLINDIIFYSNLEKSNINVKINQFDLNLLVKQVVDEQLETNIARRVPVELGESDAELFIRSDFEKIKIILRNLLSNAIKFTESGKIEVFTKLQHEENSSHIEISVVDSGIGIDESEMQGLFDYFTQLGRDVLEKSEGIGLGLSLSVKLARILGGRIAVQSKKGEGSRFTLQLPYAEAMKTKLESPPLSS